MEEGDMRNTFYLSIILLFISCSESEEVSLKHFKAIHQESINHQKQILNG